ncbi:hypothetical protein [Paracnuella aquatica]|uniref:hypothetical protein n=1 Tax=Paracnuella aquatica TaxID=2268757 RepID=UPI000F513E0B|nr:hypothetical protein [Paracnuella aquatica]RPD51296.1 hypothetical protein DRJ53_01035 [Paracnuella aquatica]
MHNQDFEQSVQQKMEELSFTPSASVWEKVRADIRPQRRRRVAFWLVPLAVVIGAGGWWLLQEGSGHEVAVNANKVPAANTTTGINSNIGITDDRPENKISSTVNEGDVAGKKENVLVNKNGTQQNARRIQQNSEPAANSSIASKDFNQKNTNTANGTGNESTVAAQPQTASRTASYSRQIFDRTGATQHTNTAAIEQARIVASISLLPPDRNQNELTVTGSKQKIALLRQEAKAVAARGAWQWGAAVHYGVANINRGNMVLQSTAADFSNVSPWPSQNGSSAPLRGPNLQLERGNYFSAGITLRRALGGGFAFGTGLQYERFTQRQMVGELVSRLSLPSNANADALRSEALYRDGAKKSYFHNKVEQVSVPLMAYVQPMRRVPLELAAGVHVGYVAGAKSLQYDTAARLYYAAKPPLNTWHVAGVAGVQYKIMEKGGWQLLGGPQVQYGLNRRNKLGSEPQRQLAYSVGLQLRRR